MEMPVEPAVMSVFSVSAVFNLKSQNIFLLYKTYFLAWSFDGTIPHAHLTWVLHTRLVSHNQCRRNTRNPQLHCCCTLRCLQIITQLILQALKLDSLR
jgi:hypothetical protein